MKHEHITGLTHPDTATYIDNSLYDELWNHDMKQFLAIAKALSEQARVRALLSLRDGELCLCQIIDLLGMAPSTVSRHMELLYQAGLVQRRKQGRWHYFRLAGREAPAPARKAIRWAIDALADDPQISTDVKQACCVRRKTLEEASACYRENSKSCSSAQAMPAVAR